MLAHQVLWIHLLRGECVRSMQSELHLALIAVDCLEWLCKQTHLDRLHVLAQ